MCIVGFPIIKISGNKNKRDEIVGFPIIKILVSQIKIKKKIS